MDRAMSVNQRTLKMELELIRYDTMNSWNRAKAPAYNLKIHKVIPAELQNRVYELMACEDFYGDINMRISDFSDDQYYCWQAGFNGRSGGYLVLYKGGTRVKYKSLCTACGQRNVRSIDETSGSKRCGKCLRDTRVDRLLYDTYPYAGQDIPTEDVPEDVLKAFKQLAEDIVNDTIHKAKKCRVEEETYLVEKTRKVIVYETE